MTFSRKSRDHRLRTDKATRGKEPEKVEVKLDCDCGAMLVPKPFVEDNHMRIAYECPKHGRIHVVDPFG